MPEGRAHNEHRASCAFDHPIGRAARAAALAHAQHHQIEAALLRERADGRCGVADAHGRLQRHAGGLRLRHGRGLRAGKNDRPPISRFSRHFSRSRSGSR
jgi:hypothetical protein